MGAFAFAKALLKILIYTCRGGIRGIIQLHVLRELEKILGPDLPVQLFFDLIVGTE